MNYTTIARSLQSKLSKRAWEITCEEAFKGFYKSHGRFKEARSSKLRLKELHAEQNIEKSTLKIVQQLCYEADSGEELQWVDFGDMR